MSSAKVDFWWGWNNIVKVKNEKDSCYLCCGLNA